MALSDAKVCEDLNTFNGSMEDGTGGSLQRRFFVEGSESTYDLAYPSAPLEATEHPDIPPIGHKLSGNGFTYYLTGYDYDRGASHQLVIITCNYESSGVQSSNPPDYDSRDNQMAEERRRKRSYGTPFNERLELQGDQEEVFSGLDYSVDGDPMPLIDSVQVLANKAIWKFDVLFRPKYEFYKWIGHCNSKDYPPGTYSSRPFAFDDKNLLYLGASGSEFDAPAADTPSGIPQSWVWKFTFSFAFRDSDWDFERQYPTKEVPFVLDVGSNLYFYDYTGQFTDDKEPGYANSGESKVNVTAEMPLLDMWYDPPFGAYIEERDPVDFHSLFGFDWSPIGT